MQDDIRFYRGAMGIDPNGEPQYYLSESDAMTQGAYDIVPAMVPAELFEMLAVARTREAQHEDDIERSIAEHERQMAEEEDR